MLHLFESKMMLMMTMMMMVMVMVMMMLVKVVLVIDHDSYDGMMTMGIKTISC